MKYHRKEERAIKSMSSNEEPSKRLGKLIRHYREEKSLLQKELAEETGIDRSYVCKIENGQVPPERTLKRISKSLALSSEEEGALLYLRLKATSPESMEILERSFCQNVKLF